jgi:very-short-patch-repair endonuclease
VNNSSGKSQKKKWRDFKQAREWARTLGLMTDKDWREYRKNGLPADIPSNPDREYKHLDEWVDMRDFLGNTNPSQNKIEWLSYLQAQEWAFSEGIKTQVEWRKRAKEESFPRNIYKAPDISYEEFTSWPEFLRNLTRMSTRRTSKGKSPYRKFEAAQEWARSQPVLSKLHWDYLAKMNKIPLDIPTNLKSYSEFKGMNEFLGNNVKGRASIKESIIALELSLFFKIETQVKITGDDFEKYIDIVIPKKNVLIEYDGSRWHRNSEKADRLVSEHLRKNGWTVVRIREEPLEKLSDLDLILSSKTPEILVCKAVVKHLVDTRILNTEFELAKATYYLWTDEFEVLDTDLASLKWLPFDEAHEQVLKLRLKSEAEWRANVDRLPENIPRKPTAVYFYSWEGWGHWLGTGNEKGSTDHMGFEEARTYVRSLKLSDARDYRVFRRQHPTARIPSDPHKYYSKWISWMDWLGTEKTAKRKRDWIEFEEAVKIARKLGLTSEAQWREFRKTTTNFPPELPKAPAQLYGRTKEWKGWPYFLKG